MVTRLSVLNGLESLGQLPSRDNDKYSYHVTKFLVKKFKIEDRNDQEASLLKKTVEDFSSKVKSYYSDQKVGNRNIKRLRTKKDNWLSIQIKSPRQKKPVEPSDKKKKKKKKAGPPKKDYLSKGRSGQYAEAGKKRAGNSLEALIHMAMLKASEDGNTDVAHVLRQLHSNPVEQGSRFRKAMEHYNKPTVIVFTPQEALALIIELNLSVNQYNKLKKKAKANHAYLYPSYDPAVTNYMKKCKPENIDTTKLDEVNVPMQSALDHQNLDILQLPSVVRKHNDLIAKCEETGLDYELKFFFKYGADGTATKSQYQGRSAGL